MRTAVVIFLCLALFLTSSACMLFTPKQAPQPTAVEAVQVQAAATLAPSNTPAPTATATLVPTHTPEPTATPNLAATEAAKEKEQMTATQSAAKTATAAAAATEEAALLALNQAVFDKLLQDGAVTRAATSAPIQVEDFHESWAQLGWYQWWKVYEVENFVVSAHTKWRSASRTADWWNSGCGFTFHIDKKSDHILVYLALDGNVYVDGYVNQLFRTMGRGYYGKVEVMEGEADVLLAVDNNKITYYVNDKKVISKELPTHSPGKGLGLTLNSGTNKDFGTECTMTDILIWDLDR